MSEKIREFYRNDIEAYEYYTPDERWEVVWGIKDKETQVKKFVIKGRFHAAVPEDVRQSTKIAEYMMAHAYYHWPLYDEALGKLLRTFEMAVRLRCQKLGIPTEEVAKNGKSRPTTLHHLLDKLTDKQFIPVYKGVLNGAREIRNRFAHPEKYGYMGPFIKLPFIPLYNILNSLFMPETWQHERQAMLVQAREQYKAFQSGLFSLPVYGKKRLIYSAEPIAAVADKDEWIYLWALHPVLLNVEKRSNPFTIALKNIESTGLSLTAVEAQSKQQIILEPTNNALNLDAFASYQESFNNLPKLDQLANTQLQHQHLGEKIEEFIFGFAWQ